MLRAPLAGILTAAVLLLQASRARGECIEADARIAFVQERLDSDDRDARRWMWEWGIAYGALTLGQAGLALTRDDEGERVELYVGAAKSALGLVPVLGLQVPALRDAARLRARVGEPDRCAVADDAAKFLAASADDEAFNRGFLAHAGNVLVNGGGLLIIGLGYDRWVTGTIGTAVGIAIGELQIFTRPTASLRGQGNYAVRWSVAPVVSAEVTGMALVGSF
jgi:hypothetical protein